MNPASGGGHYSNGDVTKNARVVGIAMQEGLVGQNRKPRFMHARRAVWMHGDGGYKLEMPN